MYLDKELELLIKHEGLELKPYVCTSGKMTIGIGRNLNDRGITELEARFLATNDIQLSDNELTKAFPFYRNNLNEIRKMVLRNMHINLGMTRLLKFKKFLTNLENKNYLSASVEMLDSRWASQVGYRAVELSNLMKGGK